MPAKKRTITLDQIFDKLLEHDKRFDDIDKRLSKHDQQFGNVATQIFAFEDYFKKQIERLDARLAVIDGHLEELTADFEKLSQEYHLITAALRRIGSTKGAFGANPFRSVTIKG